MLFIKNLDLEKRKTDIDFIDCSHILSYSLNASLKEPNTILFCLTERIMQLDLEIKNLKAFVSGGVYVITGSISGIATKLKVFFKIMMKGMSSSLFLTLK